MLITFPTHALPSWSKAELAELERFQTAAAGCLVAARWDTGACDDGTHYAALNVDSEHVEATAPLATITKDHNGYALWLGAASERITARRLSDLIDGFLTARSREARASR